ncbi:VOC family protein [Mechercharimyces sp. CAU 1602]|uniref:VOC family protein n=1 Tax=Mechercharimyces sp. CAU 1602 TaxID=2973933 RepID=UPI002163CBCE|nr:VOC family protein [Mechercharimyces sp. CAU 1602]MCS1351905.1 VOC family protein [Mechercharimyces sp. CAU 1602]
MKVSFSHLDYQVVDLAKAKRFYDPLMEMLGFHLRHDEETWISYGNGDMKWCLVQVEQQYSEVSFHRKHPGLNHVAFQVENREEVEEIANFLMERGVNLLYDSPGHFHDEFDYYALYFEDPFRLKIEVVFSHKYQSIP